MSHTVEEYYASVEYLRRACGELGDTVLSICLYGSMVNGNLQPGKSDILDALVVVQDAAIQDEYRYIKMLSVFADVCSALSARGIRFHPFNYCSRNELGGQYPVLFQAQWATCGHSEIVSGTDLRAEIIGSSDDKELLLRSYFAQRLLAQRLARYVARPEYIADGPAEARFAIYNFTRLSPTLACEAMGFHLVEQSLIDTIDGLLPIADTAALAELRSFCKEGPFSISELRKRCIIALELSEALHREVMAILGQ